MSKWGELQIKDGLIKIVDYRGFTPPKSEKGIPLISAATVKNGKLDFSKPSFISPDNYKKYGTRGFIKPGDVIITTEAPAGEIALLPDDKIYQLSRRVMALRTNEEKLHNKFLFYMLLNPVVKAELLMANRGTTVPRVLKTDITGFKIPLPPLPKQHAIAEVLSSLDDKIDLLHRQNKTLEAMAETLFRQWFVEEASEDWEEVKLSDLFHVKIGRTPPRKEKEWFSMSEHDIPWVSIRDLKDCGTYISRTAECLTENAVEQFNVPLIPKDTVLLSFKMTVGRVAITNENMLSNEAIAHFINFDNSIPNSYLFFYLKTFPYESLGSTSSIVTSINSSMIKELPILVPPKNIVDDYDKCITPLFLKIQSNQTQIQTLTQLRDTLLPKLMSGEVRVKH